MRSIFQTASSIAGNNRADGEEYDYLIRPGDIIISTIDHEQKESDESGAFQRPVCGLQAIGCLLPMECGTGMWALQWREARRLAKRYVRLIFHMAQTALAVN
jgi:hypothetical protein